MPGNGVGDRVHNFFAQENLRSQDGNLPINDNLWGGYQKQFGVSNSQQPETERGHAGQRVPDPHVFNNTHANARPEFARNLSQSQSHHEQPSSNGYMYGRQNFQTRPDEANFMGVDNVNQRGFLFFEAQQEAVPEQVPKNPFRPESSEAHNSFDLFGGQHQTNNNNNNNQYPGLLQQQQQSGFGDIQQLQQQLMLRKMQELQRQQNSINQSSQFSRQQASGSHSHGFVNGTPNSDSSGYGWTEPAAVNSANPNWLQRAEQGQPQRSVGFVQQQGEPSLYGVPVSNSRGSINQLPNNNSFPGNSYSVTPEQNMVSGKSLFGNTFGQQTGLQSSSAQDNSATDAASLDPEEQKFLFGSDDNVWKADVTGGMSSLLDDNEFASGLPSMQSGSWSALMQSAVAETTSGDGGAVGVGVQEEYPDLNFQNPVPPPGNWLHRGGQQKANIEENRAYESPVPGHRTPQQHGTSQVNNKRNQFNANEPVPPFVNTGFNMNDNENSLQQSQNNDWKRVNVAGIPNSSNLQQGGNQSNQFPPNNHNINYWKHVDSSVKSKGSENSDFSQHRNKGPQMSESSFNSSDKEDLNSSRKENSNDSYRSSSSHHPNTVGQREHFSSDAGDSRSLGRKMLGPGPGPGSGPRKFQYHPMGNLDEDAAVPYGTRQVTDTKSVPLQHSRGLGGQDHGRQGFAHEVEGARLKGSDDMRFKGMIPGHVQPSQSQNMLELLHKVDQSKDGGIARRLNSSERNLSSENPEPENSDGSFGGQQRSQSSNSQGIGLQLGPPSQRLPMTMQAVKHMSQSQPSANSRGKGHAEPSPFPPFQDAFKNNRMSVSGQSESQTGGHKMMTNLSAALGGNVAFNGHVTHPRAIPGVPQQGGFPKMMPNAWSNLQSQQLFAAIQAQKSQLNIVESTSLGKPSLEEQETENNGNKEQSTEKVDQGQTMNGPRAGNDSVNTASQKDLEAFGRSLKPNNFQQQISLMNQMKAYKHADDDPNNRLMKRLKDSDNVLHGQQVTGPTDNVNPPSKDALASDQNQIGSTSAKLMNSQISPQMAPSWFDQYGTFKGGQMVSQRSDAIRTVEKPFKVSGSLETTHDAKEPQAIVAAANNQSQSGGFWKTPLVPSSVAVDQQLTTPPLNTVINVQNAVAVRPKKRKWSRYDIRSWINEVSGSSKNVQHICAASMEWCQATRRLMEKVSDDGIIIEDVPRPKRRIILSTQLMQQLFPPPPFTLLSTDAASNYESVAFYASRLALGDACNLVSSVSHSEPNLDKSIESEIIDDKRHSKAVEDCMSKAKLRETEFSRLDERASILDLRVECQDLERFSIINRFARYHGRGQTEGEASSSETVTNVPKTFPQRYVIAVQLPKNLPDRVQCLSL